MFISGDYGTVTGGGYVDDIDCTDVPRDIDIIFMYLILFLFISVLILRYSDYPIPLQFHLLLMLYNAI